MKNEEEGRGRAASRNQGAGRDDFWWDERFLLSSFPHSVGAERHLPLPDFCSLFHSSFFAMEDDKNRSIPLSSAKSAVRITGLCAMFAGRCIGFQCLAGYSQPDILNTCIDVVHPYLYQNVREKQGIIEKLVASQYFETEAPDARIAVFELIVEEWFDNKDYYMAVGKGFAFGFKEPSE